MSSTLNNLRTSLNLATITAIKLDEEYEREECPPEKKWDVITSHVEVILAGLALYKQAALMDDWVEKNLSIQTVQIHATLARQTLAEMDPKKT